MCRDRGGVNQSAGTSPSFRGATKFFRGTDNRVALEHLLIEEEGEE